MAECVSVQIDRALVIEQFPQALIEFQTLDSATPFLQLATRSQNQS